MITAESQYQTAYPPEMILDETDVSPWAPREWKRNPAANYGLSFALCTLIALYYLIVGEQTRHWSILPLFLCGVLTGADLFRWLRGEVDVFDLKFLVSAFLFLNCFLSPLLHMTLDLYGARLHLGDWPRWFGYMALLNAGGIIAFKLSQRYFYKRTNPVHTYWQVDPGRIFTLGAPMLFVSGLALAVIHIFFGGLVKIEGVIEGAAGAGAYAGYLSVIRMLGDPFVPLAMMLLICWLHINRPDRSQSMATVFFLLAVTFVLQFLAVGLRGSRTTILSGVLTIAILIHLTVRPFSKKFILTGLAILLVFLYLYDFRKKLGTEGWRAFYDPQARQQFAYEMGGVGLHTTILFDLSRADVQAMMLHNLTAGRGELHYDYIKGKTYAMSLLTFVPRAVWPTKPMAVKNQSGAIILHGTAADGASSRVYGLSGEAMINFGPMAVIPAFIVFGSLLGIVRRKILTLSPSDARLFLAPLLMLVMMMMVNSDSDNLFFLLILSVFLPFILFFWGSMKMPLEHAMIGGYGEPHGVVQAGEYAV